MAARGTGGSMVILVVVWLLTVAEPSLQAQAKGKFQRGLRNNSRIMDFTNGISEPALASLADFPWMVLVQIRRQKKEGTTVSLCGGSVLNKQWILTAAHCFTIRLDPPTGYEILPDMHTLHSVGLYVGVTENRLSGDYGIEVQRNVYTNKEIQRDAVPRFLFIHDGYNKGTKYNNDIALFKLKQEWKLSPETSVRPVTLADQEPNPMSLLTTVGWGGMFPEGVPDPYKYTMKLRYVNELVLQKWLRCEAKILMSESMLCHYTKRKVTLKGDSGGPFMTGSSVDNYVQIGITSFGRTDFNPDKPDDPMWDVFTNVFKFRPWISETMTPTSCPSGTTRIITRTGFRQCVIRPRSCPDNEDFFTLTVGGPKQCFKVLKQSATWDQANQDCMDIGLTLAEPFAPIELRSYIVQEYGPEFYVWLGACQDEPNKVMWKRSGEEITIKDPLWFPGQPNYREGCLLLLSSEKYWYKEPEKPFWNVKKTYEFYPLCELVIQ